MCQKKTKNLSDNQLRTLTGKVFYTLTLLENHQRIDAMAELVSIIRDDLKDYVPDDDETIVAMMDRGCIKSIF